MAPRPAWKGYLKLSLVTCAVELTNAVSRGERVSFRVINRATGNTVRRQYVDSATGRPVPEEDQVKGYETGRDEFLLIEESDIDSVQIESSRTLELYGFVEKSEIEQIYLDTPYYVTPADEVSEEAFAVIREALASKKLAGLARVVLYRRERPVLIEPLGRGLLLTTLRTGGSVREPDSVFDEIAGVEVDEDMLDLATRIVDKKRRRFDPSHFEDRYEEAVHDLVEAKQAGRTPPTAKTEPRPSNVVNLFDALRKSLSEGGADGERADGRKEAAPARSKKPRSPRSNKREPA